jgi:uncharacterized protein
MRLIFLNFLFILTSLNYVIAQDTITIYFNKNWTEIPDKNQATFFRKAFLDSNKTWTVHDYYISNKIQMTGAFKSKRFNNKQGHFIYFYENGKKASEGECVNNKNEGFWTYWHENGQKKSEGKFTNDLKQDRWTYWHENGQRKSEGMYMDNNAEGKWEYWFDGGEKQSEGKFFHNRKEGDWNFFYKTGQLESIEKYKEGQLNFIMGYFENGNIKFKGNCSYGLSVGEWTYWNVDGKLIMKGNFSNDLRVGQWTRFFPNGESMKIYYEKGVLVSKQLGGIYKNE